MNRMRMFLWRVILLVLIYQGLRLGFYIHNKSYFDGVPAAQLLWGVLKGLRFDLSAIAIINAIYTLIWLAPYKGAAMDRFTKVWFIATNGLFLAANVVDLELFQFVGKRLRLASLTITEDIARTAGAMVSYYWPLTLIFVILVGILWIFYDPPRRRQQRPEGLAAQTVGFALGVGLMVFAARGGTQAKPLGLAHAFDGTDHRVAQLILNSSFTLIRSYNQTPLQPVNFLKDWHQIREALASGEQKSAPVPSVLPDRPNIVIIILESFNLEFMKGFHEDGGFTPFLDHLANQGTFFTRHFANGRRSIDALPSILAGLPSMMDDPFINSAYQGNEILGLPDILSELGYSTAFFHGGHDGTMFFDLIAARLGFKKYFGASSFPDQTQDDGRWGIFDEPFLQFTATKLTEMESPFFATLFTLSSHHPYTLPPQFEGRFKQGSLAIHESIGYTDYALKRFFETARTQPWYDKTLFILTADHTTQAEDPRFASSIGRFRVPLIWFYPGGTLPLSAPSVTTQHVDIMPTLLNLLGIEGQRRSHFGHPLASSYEPRHALLYLSNHYFLVTGDLVVVTDETMEHEVYNWQDDINLESPLSIPDSEEQKLLNLLKAEIQYYRNGMIENHLVW